MSTIEGLPTPQEQFDIVTITGDVTGQTADKSTVHRLGMLHRDVHIWLTDGQNVLQQQRGYETAIMPGEWDITAGHVSAGESYREAGVRETAEELGLDLPTEQFREYGRLAAEIVIPGWQQPHRTVGGNLVVVKHDLAKASLALEAGKALDTRLYAIDQLEDDLRRPETAKRHAGHPLTFWQLGIAAMRDAIRVTGL